MKLGTFDHRPGVRDVMTRDNFLKIVSLDRGKMFFAQTKASRQLTN